MDFGEILRVIRRRWYIAFPGMVLAFGVAIAAYVVVPTTYESQATFSLINSPRPVTAPGNGNPFLTFESSLTATADFLARSLMADDSVRELRGMGVTEAYTAALADNAMGPFITVTVTGTDQAHVLRSTAIVTEFAQAKLRTLQQQSGAPENSIIRAVIIIEPQPPAPVIKKKIEVVAGSAGFLLTLTFVATFATDSIARTRRRAERQADSGWERSAGGGQHQRETSLPAQRAVTSTVSERSVSERSVSDRSVSERSQAGGRERARNQRRESARQESQRETMIIPAVPADVGAAGTSVSLAASGDAGRSLALPDSDYDADGGGTRSFGAAVQDGPSPDMAAELGGPGSKVRFASLYRSAAVHQAESSGNLER